MDLGPPRYQVLGANEIYVTFITHMGTYQTAHLCQRMLELTAQTIQLVDHALFSKCSQQRFIKDCWLADKPIIVLSCFSAPFDGYWLRTCCKVSHSLIVTMIVSQEGW